MCAYDKQEYSNRLSFTSTLCHALTPVAWHALTAPPPWLLPAQVDKKLLGGFILEFEDRLVDLSTAKKVSEFNNLVTKVRQGRECRGLPGGTGK